MAIYLYRQHYITLSLLHPYDIDKVMKTPPLLFLFNLADYLYHQYHIFHNIQIMLSTLSICGESYEISPLLFLFNLAEAYSQVINPSLFDCSLQR